MYIHGRFCYIFFFTMINIEILFQHFLNLFSVLTGFFFILLHWISICKKTFHTCFKRIAHTENLHTTHSIRCHKFIQTNKLGLITPRSATIKKETKQKKANGIQPYNIETTRTFNDRKPRNYLKESNKQCHFSQFG